MKKINQVHRVALSGGLVGLLFTNPKSALTNALKNANVQGWYCRQILPHTTTNLFAKFLQLICLIVTLGLWTFGAGYILLLEKELEKKED